MAPTHSTSSSPSSRSKSSSFPIFSSHHSPDITTIQECEGEEQEEEESYSEDGNRTTPDPRDSRKVSTSTFNSCSTPTDKYTPTPLFEKKKKKKPSSAFSSISKKLEVVGSEKTNSVSCNKCRPNSKERISVVPLDNNSHRINNNSPFSSIPSPNVLFKSIVSTLTKRSPKSTTTTSATVDSRDERWKIAITEISHKLLQVTKQRDEAVLESSRLRNSVGELEKKLNKLEVYCHNLKSSLEECTSNGKGISSSNCQGRSPEEMEDNGFIGVISEKVIEQFLICVSEARSNVRLLSRALAMQFRHVGCKVFERISLLLQPFDVKAVSFAKNPKGSIVYLEAILNRAFFEDFESIGFQKSATSVPLNPIDRCEANYASYNVLKELTWEEVLSKGTKHYSEEFSKFCDRKMSEIVAMLGWNKAWPEPLLQAFFGASKSVWLVHLLANSLHPGLPIFRVDKWVVFDPIYMEDMGSSHESNKLVPTMVRLMVAPGFYIYGNVVKCKVLCRYYHRFPAGIDKNTTSSP